MMEIPKKKKKREGEEAEVEAERRGGGKERGGEGKKYCSSLDLNEQGKQFLYKYDNPLTILM